MDEAVRCHRVCMLSEGRRVALGTPRELVASLAGRILDVETEDPEKALSVLSSSPHVASVTQLGTLLHALIAPGEASLEAVASDLSRELAEAGLRSRVEPGHAELEDLFVDILRAQNEAA
jgi:ABC-2 type transport system ATP-binding protein